MVGFQSQINKIGSHIIPVGERIAICARLTGICGSTVIDKVSGGANMLRWFFTEIRLLIFNNLFSIMRIIH
jgi:hypothetical protein